MRTTTALLLAAALTLSGRVHAADAPTLPPTPQVKEEIAWAESLPKAFERGTKDGLPIFIAINSVRVDGGRVEPAGAMLRDSVYKDPAVVAKSKSFSCALLKSDGNSADYGELRGRYAIDGMIVSPQHILAHADGTLIERREYWSVEGVEASVAALVQMMDAALAAHRAKASGAGAAAGSAASPEAQRADWIRERLERVRRGSAEPEARDLAAKELVAGDKAGDCVEPLCGVMLEMKKDPESRCAILKALGSPGLEIALPSVLQMLDDKEPDVRSNAAVTLEYIGSAKTVEPLMKRVGREKVDVVANNVFRALGRCGAKQEPVRKILVREMGSAKSELAFAGPAIGLAYFEKDAEAARALERQAKKEGDRVKRGFLLWALTEVKDPQSAQFVKKEIIPSESNRLALAFDQSVYEVLSGDANQNARDTIDNGMGFLVRSVGGVGGSARRDRDQTRFKPKGEFGWGPGPGGGRGPGGGGGGEGGGGMGMGD